jgi:hypothetical protein
MKRFWIAAAAMFAGTIPLIKERRDVDCKNPPCAMEPIATIPEQPHASEEPPIYQVPDGWVEINTSPPSLVRKNSAEHLRLQRWLDEVNGRFRN